MNQKKNILIFFLKVKKLIRPTFHWTTKKKKKERKKKSLLRQVDFRWRNELDVTTLKFCLLFHLPASGVWMTPGPDCAWRWKSWGPQAVGQRSPCTRRRRPGWEALGGKTQRKLGASIHHLPQRRVQTLCPAGAVGPPRPWKKEAVVSETWSHAGRKGGSCGWSLRETYVGRKPEVFSEI